MKEITLIKNMSELGAGTRGSSLGADALMMAALKFGKDLFQRHSFQEVPNFNNLLLEPISNPYAKYIEGILLTAENVKGVVGRELKKGKLPFVVSGDHSNAASTIYAIKSTFPEKRLGVIWIDAHGDLHSPYTTPSGNMHGMPLAISLGVDYLELQRNQPNPDTIQKWNLLKGLGGITPKIYPEDLVFFAVRDVEKIEQEYINKEGIRNFSVAELRTKGLEICVNEAMKQLSNCDLIYLSFDVDSMDCNLVSKGTGTPVENGLSMEEAEEMMKIIIQDERLICFEMVEINPLLDDKGNKMAETAVRILDNLIRNFEE